MNLSNSFRGGHQTDRRLPQIEVMSRAATLSNAVDGGRGAETVGVSGESASGSGGLNTENRNITRHMRQLETAASVAEDGLVIRNILL